MALESLDGDDTNGNGTLDPEEILETEYLCEEATYCA